MKRGAIAVALALLPALVLTTLAWAVYEHVRIEVPPRLSPEARAAAMAVIRAGLGGQAGKVADHPDLARRLPQRGPVVISIWDRGRELGRMVGRGETIAAALEDAAREIASRADRIDPATRDRCSIKIDIVVGRGPLVESPKLLAAVALHPGIEGLGVTLGDGRELLLVPEELIAKRLLFASQPIKFVPEFKLGLNRALADAHFASHGQLKKGEFAAAKRRYWRFRTDSFVERPVADRDQPPLPLTRGVTPPPELSAEVLRDAAISGGRYLVAHLAPNGRYIYEVDLHTGRGSNPNRASPYSLPRHAGTTYFLAELYRHTKEEFLREPIERAFRHLEQLINASACEGTLPSGAAFACVAEKGAKWADLGSTALAVVALAEYRRATGETTYDALARSLTEWVLFMQRPDGSFAHRYRVAKKERDETTQLLYYSGEAALALARMHAVYGDARYIEAAERALDDLVGWYDRSYAARFFYGEEHWTCIAAEAAWPALQHDRYRRFCDGYGAFLRAQQPEPGEFPDQTDLAGGYGFTPLVLPANTPAGSRTEAMISAYLLGVHHGRPSRELERQIRMAMRYTLSQQVRVESLWNIPADSAVGAMPATPVDHMVRIDFVQHVCSAMIRTASLLDGDAATSRDRLTQ